MICNVFIELCKCVLSFVSNNYCNNDYIFLIHIFLSAVDDVRKDWVRGRFKMSRIRYVIEYNVKGCNVLRVVSREMWCKGGRHCSF